MKFADFVDKNLASRVACIQNALSSFVDCPKFVSIETVHSGKRGERIPTGITLVEFLSNADREKVFAYLKDKALMDAIGVKIILKRGSTSQQRESNAKLVKAR